MIKILHIVSDLNRNGGMMSVIINYYRNINRDLIQFDFLSFEINDGDYSDEIAELGGNVYTLGRPKMTMKYIKSMNSFFMENAGKYKAIHCHPIFASEIFANSAKNYGIKHVIAHSHSTQYSNKKKSAVRNYLINLFVENFATNFMACSKEAAKLFKRVVNKDIYILNNAIDCNKFKFNLADRTKIRNELKIKDNEIVLGHIGRFSTEKNHTFILEVFKEFCNLNFNGKLVLVGNGPLDYEIRKKVRQLGLSDKVIFTGERSDVEDVLCALDIFLLPSIFEGVPVSAIEAQASGVTCFLSSSITRIVSISDVHYIDISEGANNWAIKINNVALNNEMRNLSYIKVKKAGFDILTEAKKLEIYYINL